MASSGNQPHRHREGAPGPAGRAAEDHHGAATPYQEHPGTARHDDGQFHRLKQVEEDKADWEKAVEALRVSIQHIDHFYSALLARRNQVARQMLFGRPPHGGWCRDPSKGYATGPGELAVAAERMPGGLCCRPERWLPGSARSVGFFLWFYVP